MSLDRTQLLHSVADLRRARPRGTAYGISRPWLVRCAALLEQLANHEDADISAIAQLASERLRGIDAGPIGTFVEAEADSALAAISQRLGGSIDSLDSTEALEVSRVRARFAKLRFEASREEPVTTGEYRQRLRRFGTVLATIRGEEACRRYVDDDTLALLVDLQARILRWLLHREQQTMATGRRLWGDSCAAVAVLDRVTTLPDTSRFDRPSVSELHRRVQQEKRLTRRTLKSFERVRGIDPEIDRIFEESNPSAEALKRALAKLAELDKE
ncbi:MAG: hypothetical protein AAGF12_14360 [Myxococcota bacterium]